MTKKKSTTPMMVQYQAIRDTLPKDVLLFYRLGDFYELFYEDANDAAQILNLALTKRQEVPMCGMPHHASKAYIAKLIAAGRRVALAEQVSEPQVGKLVNREIKSIISAGTTSDCELLDEKKPSFLISLYHFKGIYALASIDHSTGFFQISEHQTLSSLEDEIERSDPAEILISEAQIATFNFLTTGISYNQQAYHYENAYEQLCQHFKVSSLEGLGCQSLKVAITAAGALLHYLKIQMRQSIDHFQNLSIKQSQTYVGIDASSQRNLDLVESRAGRSHTLLGVLDKTHTSLGARKLRHWVLNPLRELTPILDRQKIVENLLGSPQILKKLQGALKGLADIERVTTRLSQDNGNARDFLALTLTLDRLPEIKDLLGKLPQSPLNQNLSNGLHRLPHLVDLGKKALTEEPPVSLKEGGMIRQGFSAELDEMLLATSEGKNWLVNLQVQERKATGIDSLKVKYNQVFGYFIEVTKPHLAKVPETYHSKQTTATAGRFMTAGLKEMEQKILGAQERSKQLEYEIFLGLKEQVRREIFRLQQIAEAIAIADVLVSFAVIAQLRQYCKPLLDESKTLTIEQGKHPVLDQLLTERPFIANDIQMEADQSQFLLITGPNMAGKSTYIRQVALIVLMAQMGAFVPAKSAHLGLVDQVFCRVGASDDLSRGRSTFMVEMHETALILNQATTNSLVILDEIGRGTATFDGLSIAWSVTEYLHDVLSCRSLFATHYHELADLEKTCKKLKNLQVAAYEKDGDIVLLHRIIPGRANHSYGIEVARLAGFPETLINRSRQILQQLEFSQTTQFSKESTKATLSKSAKSPRPKTGSPQLNLFQE